MSTTTGCTVVFCLQCRSSMVDVIGWTRTGDSPATATVRCSDCGHQAKLEGFTLGRYMADDEVRVSLEARSDAVFAPRTEVGE